MRARLTPVGAHSYACVRRYWTVYQKFVTLFEGKLSGALSLMMPIACVLEAEVYPAAILCIQH